MSLPYLSRRKLLQLIALTGAMPSLSIEEVTAWIHGSASAFNGGLSQGQPNFSYFGFAFIDLVKEASGWLGTETINSNSSISPAWLDTSGFPLSSIVAAGHHVRMNVNVPLSTSFPANASNPLVMVWKGANAGTTVNIGNNSVTFIAGYANNTVSTLNATTGLYEGRMEFYPTYTSGAASFQLNVTGMGASATLTQFSCYFLSDEADFNSGKVFRSQFLSLMRTLRYGVFRFMDWFWTNATNQTTWSTRRTLANPSYATDEFRASLFPGDIMTNVGNDYSIAFGSGAPTDKQTIHVTWNANATLVQNSESGAGGTLTLTLPGGGAAVTFNWTSHPFSNGDPVSIFSSGGGVPIQGFFGANSYVVNATTNSFQVAATPGGAALGSTSTSTNGRMTVVRLPTLNLNSTGAIPVRDIAGNTLDLTTSLPSRFQTGGVIQIYATLVYDAQLNSWLSWGGSTGLNSGGIRSALPPELMVLLCTEIGAHPHFSIPYMALDPITDFVPSLATYVKSNGPPWMKPRFEPGNEVWNNVTSITNYAYNKAYAYWGTTFDAKNWVGYTLSLLGQAVAGVYGIGNLGSSYEVMCGVDTGDFGAPVSSSSALLNSTNFVSTGPTPPAGYSRVAAKGYTSAMLLATYVTPGMCGTLLELENAWNYYVTNIGNPTAQLANLNAYADSLNQGVSGTGVFTIASPGIVNWPSHGRSVDDALFVGATGALPGGLSIYSTYYVSNIIDANSFNISTSRGGASIAFTGTQSGTQYVAYGLASNFWASIRYINCLALGQANGVNKMFAYEGGYSPNLLPGTSGLGSSFASPITGASQASQCVLTLATTISPSTVNGSTYRGNPAIAGMVLNVRSVAGMTQLNCVDSDTLGNVTFTNASANITWASNILIVGQVVQFQPSSTLPSNLTANTPYYVVSAGNPFQVSATKGGTAIVMSGGGSAACYSGWIVASVSGNSVTIDVNSLAFGAWTSGGTATYLGSGQMINNFRLAVLQNATDLPAQLLANYTNFTNAGGLNPSQYGIVGGSVWVTNGADIWQPLNQEGTMIAAYN